MAGTFRAMSKAKKVLVVFGVIIGFFTLVGILAPPADETPTKDLVQTTASVKSAATEDNKSSDTQASKPKITTQTVTETIPIPYQTITQNDPTLLTGKTTIALAGTNGEKTITYKVTYTDGVETKRQITNESITKEPINEIKKIGTKVAVAPPAPPTPPPASNCHPSYSSPCVPYASDVDCASGSGNGPAYVAGPVYVVGPDVYDLDRDGNGVGCE